MVTLSDMFGGGDADTFLGLPEGASGDIVIFGADCATPYPSVGPYCAGGAAAIRAGSADYAGEFDKFNFDIGGEVLPSAIRAVDAGDINVNPDDPQGNRAAIREAVRACLTEGGVPVLLGGDDSVPIPMLDAFDGEGPITILQIDAHIDWRDEVEGVRMGLSSTMRRASEMAHVERIVQVGARGVGSARREEVDAARAWGARFVPAKALHEAGHADVLAAIPDGARVVICFDCDALDPAIMPAVIAPTGGGLSYAQALSMIEAVAQRTLICGFALVEFKADADIAGKGALTAAQLLTSVLGLIAGQVAAKR